MVGPLKIWKISGITTDEARNSELYYLLGSSLADPRMFKRIPESDQLRIYEVGHRFEKARRDFLHWLNTSGREPDDNIVLFLVRFAAVTHGREGRAWDWKEVRHLSQGLFGSLDNSPTIFRAHNVPMVLSLANEIRPFLHTAPYEFRTKQILLRLEEGYLSRVESSVLLYTDAGEAFRMSAKLSKEDCRRSEFGQSLERYQTWMHARKTKQPLIDIGINVYNPLDNMITGFLFAISRQLGRDSLGPKCHLLFTTSHPLVPHLDAWLTAKVPSEFISPQGMKDGTIWEAWE